MEINQILSRIIPPEDYYHRKDFSNKHLIDSLQPELRSQVELELISKLRNDTRPDMLVVETLGYLKSSKAVPILKKILNEVYDVAKILILSSAIFQINQDVEMEDIAVDAFNKIDEKDAYYVYSVKSSFYYLITFKSERVKAIIRSYQEHDEYLIAYNAKRCLEIS